MRRLRLAIGLLALTSSLVFAAPAAAANVVPNAGFESACGSPTKACSWPEQADANAEYQRDPTIGHAGSSASYRLKTGSGGAGMLANSDCITPQPVSAANALIGFWYRTIDAGVSEIRMVPFFHTVPTCNVSASGPLVRTTAPIADGEWHQVSRSVTITDEWAVRPALWFHVAFFCAAPCGDAQVHLDDLVFEQTPTAVRVAVMRVQATRTGILVRWRTVSEVNALGFNLYRRLHGKLTKLNAALIPSVFGGTTSGHRYAWLDRSRQKGAAKYRLQAVSLSGTKSWVGSAAVAR